MYVEYVALLLLGIAIFVLGLLQAAHAPFQRWWYGTEWYNPSRKGSVDVSSDEYKTAIAYMKMTGAKFAGVGGLMMLSALSALGLIH